MKNALTVRFVFILLLAVSFTAGTMATQNRSSVPSIPQNLTLTFELQDLPGGNVAGSFWEVSYQWRIADKSDFDKWSRDGEDLILQNSLGILLSKGAFTRPNLLSPEDRRFIVSVPVRGKLSELLRNGDRRPQIVWLDASVRIHDANLGIDVIKTVNPVWGPYFYRVGTASVRIELTQTGKLQWYTGDNPPWLLNEKDGLSTSRVPIPK